MLADFYFGRGVCFSLKDVLDGAMTSKKRWVCGFVLGEEVFEVLDEGQKVDVRPFERWSGSVLLVAFSHYYYEQ